MEPSLGEAQRDRWNEVMEDVRISASADGSDSVVLEVADWEPGIPDGHLERIFEPFYRSATARERDSGGTGLGLAIVRSSVQARGGTVSAANRVPVGLAVRLRLPLW